VKRMLRHLYHLAKKEIDALILSDEVGRSCCCNASLQVALQWRTAPCNLPLLSLTPPMHLHRLYSAHSIHQSFTSDDSSTLCMQFLPVTQIPF